MAAKRKRPPPAPLSFPCPHKSYPHDHRTELEVELCGRYEAGWRLDDTVNGFEPASELLKHLVPPPKPPAGGEQMDLFRRG